MLGSNVLGIFHLNLNPARCLLIIRSELFRLGFLPIVSMKLDASSPSDRFRSIGLVNNPCGVCEDGDALDSFKIGSRPLRFYSSS